MRTGSLKAVFPFIASPKLQAIAEKSETPQARGPLRAVCLHVAATHRSYTLCQATSETGVLKFVVQVRVMWVPPKKVFLFQTVWKITFMEPATLIQLNHSSLTKKWHLRLVSVDFCFGKKPGLALFCDQIHEKKPFSEAEIQSLGIECDMPPLRVVIRKATGIWRLGSRFSVYFGSMETPGLSWDDCEEFWFDWLGDDEIPNLETKDEGIESGVTYCLWTCCMIGRKYSEDQARQIWCHLSFWEREREREREGMRCKFDLFG